MEHFTPTSALIGGGLIGAAAAALLWFDGRIAGISGILNGLLTRRAADETLWRGLFLAGLVVGAGLYVLWAPSGYAPRTGFPPALLILGGVLVGFGTRMGGGCTSGHGVCGIARLSIRSLVATVVFIFSGMVTVLVVRHMIGVAP